MKHKWRKGKMPQTCINCGLIRTRRTFKHLMAITPDGKNHYQYETKIVYISIAMTIYKAPPCIGVKVNG